MGATEDAPTDIEGHPAVLVTKFFSIQVLNQRLSISNKGDWIDGLHLFSDPAG